MEELIQEEIIDETDVYVDVARQIRVGHALDRQDMSHAKNKLLSSSTTVLPRPRGHLRESSPLLPKESIQ